MAASVRVKGRKKLSAGIATKQRQIEAGSVDGVAAVGEAMLSAVEKRVPRDSGELAKGQEIRYSKNGRRAQVGTWKPELFWHAWVHEGNSRIKGNPYLDIAAADVRPDVPDLIAAEINREMKAS